MSKTMDRDADRWVDALLTQHLQGIAHGAAIQTLARVAFNAYADCWTGHKRGGFWQWPFNQLLPDAEAQGWLPPNRRRFDGEQPWSVLLRRAYELANPQPAPNPRGCYTGSALDERVIAIAREDYDDDTSIDDEPALSWSEDGCFVAAWVWVRVPVAAIELASEEPPEHLSSPNGCADGCPACEYENALEEIDADERLWPALPAETQKYWKALEAGLPL